MCSMHRHRKLIDTSCPVPSMSVVLCSLHRRTCQRLLTERFFQVGQVDTAATFSPCKNDKLSLSIQWLVTEVSLRSLKSTLFQDHDEWTGFRGCGTLTTGNWILHLVSCCCETFKMNLGKILTVRPD